MFATENEMSIAFEQFLIRNDGSCYKKELKGLAGIPDYVFHNLEKDTFIAFELKLKDWKRASKQAFRYRSFADKVFVVMPEQNAKSALKNIDHFRKFNIGLATFNNSDVFEILFSPEISKPYSERLSNKLIACSQTNATCELQSR
jgi:hypothetical protein